MVNDVVLHANDDVVLKSLVAETWCCAVLDSGASSTVCGATWFDEFATSLPEGEKSKIKFAASEKSYRFGDGKVVKAIRNAVIPAYFGNWATLISTDIVDTEIPLLLSKTTMKRAGMKLDFDEDTLDVFGEKIHLTTTNSGLYSFSLTKSVHLLEKLEQPNQSFTLRVTSEHSTKDIARKLHRSFAHPSADKIIRLLDKSGPNWSNNKDLKAEIKRTSDSCSICKVYKKPQPRPVVSLPMASKFQEIVSMDLKQYEGKLILHMIDLCTKLSAATFIPNKKRETIIFKRPLKHLTLDTLNYSLLQLHLEKLTNVIFRRHNLVSEKEGRLLSQFS